MFDGDLSFKVDDFVVRAFTDEGELLMGVRWAKSDICFMGPMDPQAVIEFASRLLEMATTISNNAQESNTNG